MCLFIPVEILKQTAKHAEILPYATSDPHFFLELASPLGCAGERGGSQIGGEMTMWMSGVRSPLRHILRLAGWLVGGIKMKLGCNCQLMALLVGDSRRLSVCLPLCVTFSLSLSACPLSFLVVTVVCK